jgi:outer membrane receptor for ferrienterochelin and colicin
MKRIVVLVLSLFITTAIFAQTGSISGKVVQKSDGAPMSYVMVTLLKDSTAADQGKTADASKIVTGAMTDTLGNFSIQNINNGKYLLQFSFVGLSDYYMNVDINGSTTIPTVTLDDTNLNIGEAVVVADRPTFTQKLDKKVYDIGNDVMATTGSISDLLRNVPTLDVSLDGTISLRGNSNVMILVDGRPSAMMNSKNRGEILQQLSAGQIERIEVITNPSAEYKPDGVSGIINIVQKKNVKPGFNGSLNANVGSNGRYGAGTTLSYHRGKFNIIGGLSYRKDRYDRVTDDKRTYSSSNVHEITNGEGHPKTLQTNLGMSIDLTPQDKIEASGSYGFRRFHRSEDIQSVRLDSLGSEASRYSRTRQAHSTEDHWDAAFHYTHEYGKANSFQADYNYSSENESEENYYHTVTTTPDSTMDAMDRQHVYGFQGVHSAKLSLEQHFGDALTLNSGYELEALKAKNSFHLYDYIGNDYVYNTSSSSDFMHKRLINSLYSTLKAELGSWELLGGLRGEYVSQHSHLYTLDSLMSQHYFSIYPSFHAAWNYTEKQSIMFSYSLRVNRPEGDEMNPFPEYLNPLSLRSGNPDLKPEKIHSLELGWQWHDVSGTNFLATLYERHIMNEITDVSYYLDNGVLLTRPENTNATDEAGLEVVWSQPVGKWLNFNWNVNGFYNKINLSEITPGSNKDAFEWSTMLNANLTPIKHLTVQLNSRYRSGSLLPQGHSDPDFIMNMGAKYDIPSINLTFICSVTDVFDTYKRSYTLDTPELKQKVEMRRNPRIIYLGAVWNFGIGQKKASEIKYDEGL